jgi:hypothetical protein
MVSGAVACQDITAGHMQKVVNAAPTRTPAGYPLAERLAARLAQARAEQGAETNPQGLVVLTCRRDTRAAGWPCWPVNGHSLGRSTRMAVLRGWIGGRTR